MTMLDNFAEEAYERDRSNEAKRYWVYLDQVEALVSKLHAAMQAEMWKEAKVLRRELKRTLQLWPIFLFLDIVEERVELLVKQLVVSLHTMRKSVSAEIRAAAFKQLLSTVQEERLAVSQYREGSNG